MKISRALSYREKNAEQPHFVIYNNDTSFEGYWYKNGKEMSFSASIESCKNLLDVFISWAEAMEERGASIGLFETKKEPKVDLVKEE